MALEAVGRTISISSPFVALTLNTHTHAHPVNIPVLVALFLCQLRRCFLKHDESHSCSCRWHAGESGCLHVYLHVCKINSRDRYGQQDGSESAECRWVLYYSVRRRNIQNSGTLCCLLPLCTVTPSAQHQWDSQLPVVLTETLAASIHVPQ